MIKSARRKIILPIVIVCWLFAIGVGLRFVLAYENSPGTVGGVPRIWPVDSRVPHSANLPTLVMMVHPQCPCSRASIGELALLMAGSQERVKAIVVFVRPWEFADQWERTDLWHSVEAIRGVTLSVDPGGTEARRFGSQTSGHVLLYSPDGQLLFSGGITSARGHSGDNEGRRAIVALLTEGRAESNATPVFGCSLFNRSAQDNPEELCNASHQ